MTYYEKPESPTVEEQQTAYESYEILTKALETPQSITPEIEIEETKQRVKLPMHVFKLLIKILEETSKGQSISILPLENDVTTQSAADILGCSRPHLIKLLERGEIPFKKIGKHRRIKAKDLIEYKSAMKKRQRALLIEMMREDEESGLYDT